MELAIEPGKYVVAVSGGVDSMVLLDLLVKQAKSQKLKVKSFELIVAHFDHGIRPDSYKDKALVERTAKKLSLVFEYAEGKLGPKASEDTARNARYEFLHMVRKKHEADAIITAHHQDDLIETALLNLLRGTGRKGLSSLKSIKTIKRPLLTMSKKQILKYATTNKITWREDITNQDESYLRNYVRKKIVPKLKQSDRQRFLDLLSSSARVNEDLDQEIAIYLQNSTTNELPKSLILNLSHTLAGEVMAEWLRRNGIRDFDRKLIERLVIAAKTFRSGQRADINKMNYLLIEAEHLKIVTVAP